MICSVETAAKILRRGGVVAFPTETVYGLGARAFDPQAIQKIFRAKGRPRDNPLIVHVSSPREVSRLVRRLSPIARTLIRAFWPGPLTLILPKKKDVPPEVTAGLPTVAVRMPGHPVARRLIRLAGQPLAAPSANLSGRPSGTRLRHVVKELERRVDGVVRGAAPHWGLESTVVDLSRKPYRLLRPGCVTLEQLQKYVPGIRPAGRAGSGTALSPGLKHRHYTPHCRVRLLPSGRMGALLRKIGAREKRIGVLSVHPAPKRIPGLVFRRRFSGSRDLARHLYDSFYKAEAAGVRVLVVESMERRGLGRALMDRLLRASH